MRLAPAAWRLDFQGSVELLAEFLADLGAPPRVWVDGSEVADVYARFADIQLTPEPVIEISGASGVPMLLAMAAGQDWAGHVPGPNGLPGGYPVKLAAGRLELELPPGVTRDDAIFWNLAFERANGLVVEPGGTARFTGRLRDEIGRHRPALRDGFRLSDLEAVSEELLTLRAELERR